MDETLLMKRLSEFEKRVTTMIETRTDTQSIYDKIYYEKNQNAMLCKDRFETLDAKIDNALITLKM